MSVFRVSTAGAIFSVAVTLTGCRTGTPSITSVNVSPPITVQRIQCDPIDQSLHDQYKRYAEALQYLDIGHVPGRGFVGDLVDGPPYVATRVLGPEAEIWPQTRALHNTRGALVDGRVVARVDVTPPQLSPEVLNLPEGRSWIAVCLDNANATTGKALIIPSALNVPMRSRDIRIVRLPDATKHKKHANAYFQGGATSMCVTCTKYSWCHVE